MVITQEYSLEAQDDECLEGAQQIATDTGKPIRLRVQPQLFTATPNRYRAGMYYAWKGVSWNLSCPTVSDVIEVRDALASFFRLLEQIPGRLLAAEFDSRLRLLADSPAQTVTTTIRTAADTQRSA